MEGFLVLYFLFLTEVTSLPKYRVPGSYCVDLDGSDSYLKKGVTPLLHGFNLWRKAIKLPLPLYGCLESVLMPALSSFIINQIMKVIFPACYAAGDTKPRPPLTEVSGQPSILQWTLCPLFDTSLVLVSKKLLSVCVLASGIWDCSSWSRAVAQ